jgi:hypothetical protein
LIAMIISSFVVGDGSTEEGEGSFHLSFGVLHGISAGPP